MRNNYFEILDKSIRINTPPKILICGNSGSGKSTLAKLISDYYHIPHIEIDHLFWLPGWKIRPKEEFNKLLDKELLNPSWIIDNAGVKLVSELSNQATLVIWLDLPSLGNLVRVMRRSLKRRFFTHVSPIGQEKLIEIFKLWRYVLRYNKERKPLLEQGIGQHHSLIKISHWNETLALLNALRQNKDKTR